MLRFCEMINMDNTVYEQLRLDNQLCFPLYACARPIVNQYTPYLKPLGITYTQYIVMLVLWEQDGLTVGEIGKKLILDNGTLTPLLKKLESEGYIKRDRSKQDERIVVITLTDTGRELREKVKDIPFKVGSCIRLDPEEAGMLHTILHKLMNGIERKAE